MFKDKKKLLFNSSLLFTGFLGGLTLGVVVTYFPTVAKYNKETPPTEIKVKPIEIKPIEVEPSVPDNKVEIQPELPKVERVPETESMIDNSSSGEASETEMDTETNTETAPPETPQEPTPTIPPTQQQVNQVLKNLEVQQKNFANLTQEQQAEQIENVLKTQEEQKLLGNQKVENLTEDQKQLLEKSKTLIQTPPAQTKEVQRQLKFQQALEGTFKIPSDDELWKRHLDELKNKHKTNFEEELQKLYRNAGGKDKYIHRAIIDERAKALGLK